MLVGNGNPEEGEPRPQLLDRFGLSVEVTTPTDLPERIEAVRCRDAYERDPLAFIERWKKDDERTRCKLTSARTRLDDIEADDAALESAARLSIQLGTDGLRGELTLMRAARAFAAFEGATRVGKAQLRRIAAPALRHRLRREPLDASGSGARVGRAIAEVLAD